MNKIYSFIFEAGEEGRTLTELSRRFRRMNRSQMAQAITKLTVERTVQEVATHTDGRPVTRIVATGGEPATEGGSNERGSNNEHEELIRRRLIETLATRVAENRNCCSNYCPACGADISGRTKQVTTYTAAVAQPANRGLGFSIDVWRVCERCAIKIMTGEHKDLIVSNSIGAAVIRNMEAEEASRGR